MNMSTTVVRNEWLGKAGVLVNVEGGHDIICTECGRELSGKQAEFSIEKHGKAICINCQKLIAKGKKPHVIPETVLNGRFNKDTDVFGICGCGKHRISVMMSEISKRIHGEAVCKHCLLEMNKTVSLEHEEPAKKKAVAKKTTVKKATASKASK
jgi:hypothetical protein